MTASKNTKNTIPEFGGGIFLIKDVSYILKISQPKVRYWLKEFWDNRFGEQENIIYSIGDSKNKAINFNTLIEFCVFYKLRERGLSAQSIQKYHSIISKELKTPYPFALAEISTDDNKKVWYQHLENLIKADGKTQFSIRPILKPFLQNIEFDKKNHLALRLFPLGKSAQIVIDPKHQFGQPTIKGTNIKAEIISRLHDGGEQNETIRHLYNITDKQVSDAIKFYKRSA